MSRYAQFETILRTKYGSHYRRARGKVGIEFRICCPFCMRNVGKADRKYKLYMNPEMNVYRCYRCPARGQLSDLFGKIAWTEKSVFVQPASHALVDAPSPGELVSLCDLPADHVAIRYLRNRRFDPARLDRQFGVRYCTSGWSYLGGLVNTTNTLIFPVWMNNRLVAWQSRLLYNPDDLTEPECKALGLPEDPDEPGTYLRPPKYFTSPGADKGRLMFNYDRAKMCEFVAVSEGPLDTCAVGPAGVATLGKGVSEAQEKLLATTLNWKLIILLLDPGDADPETRQLRKRMCVELPTVPVKLEGYKDPGEAPTKEIWRQIDIQVRACGWDLANYNWGPHWSPDVFKE